MHGFVVHPLNRPVPECPLISLSQALPIFIHLEAYPMWKLEIQLGGFLKSKFIFKNIKFLFLGATNYDQLRNATLDSLRKSYRTIVVRHPFERLLSAYLWFLGEEKGKT